jgi:hypothetical protein
VENIYKANESDFIKSTIKVYGNSVIEVGGEQGLNAVIDLTK